MGDEVEEAEASECPAKRICFYFYVKYKDIKTLNNLMAFSRIPGTGEPGGLTSMGSHRVGHD